MARTRSEGAKDEYEFFNQGHVLHGGRGHINPGLPPNASGPGSPWKPVEERREKKGMTPLQMALTRVEICVDGVGADAVDLLNTDLISAQAAAARTRRRSGTGRLEGRPLGRSETGPPALGI